MLEKCESHTSPQAFLNPLETRCTYPDSSELLDVERNKNLFVNSVLARMADCRPVRE